MPAFQSRVLSLGVVAGGFWGAAVAWESEQPDSAAAASLGVDDECLSREPGADRKQCALSALQLRSVAKAQSAAEASEAGASADESGDAQPWLPPWMGGNAWGGNGGYQPWWEQGPSPPYEQGGGWGGNSYSPAPLPPGVQAPAAIPAQSPTPAQPAQPAAQGKCGSLDSPENAKCKEPIDWVSKSGKYDPNAQSWFEDMKKITGVDYLSASKDDFQRLYYCAPPGGKQCGTPPCSCSKPPCGSCFAGAPGIVARAGCSGMSGGIQCKPPPKPMDYKGMSWPQLKYHGVQQMHIFAVGDWGGMDGSLNPIEGRPRIIAYKWGSEKGPSVFPRTRWDKHHRVELCNHKQFITCFNTRGSDCPASCGFVTGVDDKPQQLVAQAMEARARLSRPQYILNVGDNFYWGGIEKTCGTPMHELSYTAFHQFNQIFETVYNGPGLKGLPWLSVLGNHDWGGRQFNNGWDQQIAYTWHSERWIMPAPYYMVPVSYPEKGFTVDIYMLDSNVRDAKSPPLDSEHNICGSAHNPKGADCSAVGGPPSVEACPGFFHELWQEQKQWLEQKLSESSATWQIMVTHFPCGEDGENQAWYRKLHTTLGLDLMVTGHRHDQELWLPHDGRNRMGGLTCMVTGGGGGITSEATPDPMNKKDWYGEAEYGFYDITIGPTSMFIESINYDGTLLKSTHVYPKMKR